MKQFLLGCLLFCLIPKQHFAQFKIHPDSSFYTFLDSFYTYYQDDGTEGGIYNQVRRDVMTWAPRLAPSGSMQKANQAITIYSKIYNNPNNSSSFSGGSTPIVFPPTHPLVQNWNELGPTTLVDGPADGRGMGQIHRIAFHPNYNGTSNQIIYAGSHYGGLYRTNDGGSNWYNYHTDRGLPMTSIGGVAVSNDRVFVCTGNGDHGYANFGQDALYHSLGPGRMNDANPIHTQGVYYNHTSNTQWIPINGNSVLMIDNNSIDNLLTVFERGGTMRNILVHPNNDNILLIATSQGIFRTTNRGTSWQQVLIGPPNGNGGYILDTEWRGLEFHPTNPNIVYASGKDIYQSIDGGITWGSMTNNQVILTSPSTIRRINIAVTPAAPNNLYAYVIGHNANPNIGKGYVYLYINNNWVLQNGILDSSPDFAGFAVSSIDSNIVFLGGIKIYRGINVNSTGNATFQKKHNLFYIHDDVHELKMPPLSGPVELFAGTHGGVSKADSMAHDWIPLYNGLGVSTIWNFDDWEGNDSIIITANQDVGVNQTLSYGTTWKSYVTADGYGARIDDQTGFAYLKYNNYQGLFQLYPTYQKLDEYPNNSSSDIILPKDSIYLSSDIAIIQNSFPMENHPKDESAYLGFTELYLRKNSAVNLEDLQNETIDTLLPGLVHFNVNNGSIYASYSGTTCSEIGTIISVNNFFTTFTNAIGLTLNRVDTLCRIVRPQAVQDYIWEQKSDIKKIYPNQWDRRIMNIAFSEDENTNYTYLSTAGWSNSFQSGFYFNNSDSFGCDTCFISKTANIPCDITAPANHSSPITGIAVDPLNGNRLWLSFSGYNKTIKVFFSNDAGNTWTSYDDSNHSLENLNVPINDIVYQRGTKDRLYIATDVGVYVREDGGDWLRYSENFPNVRTTELKINYCIGKLRAATFGRGAWENDLLPPENNINYRSFRTVSGYEVWNTDKNMSRDIRVKAGAILVLDSITLNMPKDGLIIVEVGATLRANGSTITNLCGKTWQGIQVWGNSALPQNQQGVLVLNGATIKFAKNAVSPWQVGNYPNPISGTGGTGGLIHATNSHFINNWRSIDFMRYISPSTIPIQNPEYSTIFNCTFTFDDNARSFHQNLPPSFLGHISMWAVGGTEIKGCTFKDERSNKTGGPNTGGVFGILAYQASPKIGRLVAADQRNHFEGIERAIEIGGARATNYTTTIDKSNFVDNEQAIILRTQNHVKIIRDSFIIGGFNSTNSNNYFVEEYGLGVMGATTFDVEQNYFTSSNSSDQTIGSWIEDAGSGGNQIRNNTYENLTGGNVAHGANDGFLPDDGLQYLCNTNLNNSFDFTVLPNITSNAAPANIGKQQGSPTQASRNTFSAAIQTLPSQAQFYNFDYNPTAGQLNPPLFYYYTSNPLAFSSETPNTSLLLNVNELDVPIGNQNFCAENFIGTGTFKIANGLGEILRLEDLKKEFYNHSNEWNRLQEEYNELEEEDSLSQQVLAGELAAHYREQFYWANQVIYTYANDSIVQNDSIAIWIQNKPGVAAQYELVEHYWRQNRYQDALDLIQNIPNRYTLLGRFLDNHNNYFQLKTLLYTAYQAERVEATLEKEEVTILEEIAANKFGFAAIEAANILRFFYNKGTAYYPNLPISAEVEGRFVPDNSSANPTNEPIYVSQPTITGTPNPAINWIDLSYQLPEEMKEATLVLTATTGTVIQRLSVQKNSGILTINTANWLSGVYFATLITETNKSKSFTFVIQK